MPLSIPLADASGREVIATISSDRPPSVREVVRRLEVISHFQRGGTEGRVGLLGGTPRGGSEEAGAAERGARAAAGQGGGDLRGDAAQLAPRGSQPGAAPA